MLMTPRIRALYRASCTLFHKIVCRHVVVALHTFFKIVSGGCMDRNTTREFVQVSA